MLSVYNNLLIHSTVARQLDGFKIIFCCYKIAVSSGTHVYVSLVYLPRSTVIGS